MTKEELLEQAKQLAENPDSADAVVQARVLRKKWGRVKEEEESLYAEMIELFKEEIREYDPDTYIDLIEKKDPRKRFLVPFWAWHKKYEEIRRILVKYIEPDQKT